MEACESVCSREKGLPAIVATKGLPAIEAPLPDGEACKVA